MTNTFKHTILVVHHHEEQNLYFCSCNTENKPHEQPYFTETAEEYRARRDAHIAAFRAEHGETAWPHTYEGQKESDSTKCPNCEKPVDIRMSAYGHRQDFASHNRVEYAKLYDNGHLISLSYGFGTYIYNGDARKLGYKQDRYRLTFNANTGFLYHLKGKQIRNVTYKFENMAVFHHLHQIERDLQDYIVDNFFNLCKERRGLKYVDDSRFEGASQLTHLPLLLKFPVLENFPTYKLSYMPAVYRKPLSQMTKATEVFELFVGTSAKAIRKQLTGASAIEFYREWSRVLNQPSSLQKMLKAWNDTNAQSGRYVASIFEAEDNSPFRVDDDIEEVFAFALEHYGNGDETILVNRILNEQREIHDFGTREVTTAQAAPSHVLYLLRDISRMYAELKAALPDYETKYRTSFKHIHDRMIVEHGRLRNKNILIPYSEEEKKRYNVTLGDIEFRLAETTDRLRDIGRKLDICVGGYGSIAVQKTTTIVQAYYQGQYIICLEVRNDELWQAKTPYNHTPNKELVEVVKAWSEKAKVGYKDCHDLDGSYDESLESIMRAPSDEEILLAMPDVSEVALGEDEELPVADGYRAPVHYPQAPPAYAQPAPVQLIAAEPQVAYQAPIAGGYVTDDDLPF